MSNQTILQKARAKYAKQASQQGRSYPPVVYTVYTSLPVPVPEGFLAPLPDPSVINVKRINFAESPLPEYKKLYAVVLDNVLTQDECDQLLRMAEMSTGAHGNHAPTPAPNSGEGSGTDEGEETGTHQMGPENNGWKPAMVNAGRNHEVLAIDYRNSDRIIWDEESVTRRLWARVMQGEGMKEYFSVLDGKEYVPVVGPPAEIKGERWVISKQGLNERMRFLKYGVAQYFKGLFSCHRRNYMSVMTDTRQSTATAPTKRPMVPNAHSIPTTSISITLLKHSEFQ
jgi:hypothetical protein